MKAKSLKKLLVIKENVLGCLLGWMDGKFAVFARARHKLHTEQDISLAKPLVWLDFIPYAQLQFYYYTHDHHRGTNFVR